MIFVEPSREKSQRQAMTMTPTPSQQISGLIAAAAASISLGVITPAARIAYDGGVSTTTLVAFRVAVATVITAGLVALFRRPWAFNPAALRPTLATTLGILMVAFGYMSSVLFIPVSLSALIFFTFPIIVLVHASLTERRAPNLATIVAFAAAFGGLTLALGPSFQILDLRGVGCALIAAIGACLVMITGSWAARRMDALTLTFYTQVFCLPVVFAVLFSIGTIAMPTDRAGWAGLNIAAAGYIAGMCLLMVAVRLANPAPVSMINNLEPIVTLLAAALILGERMTAIQYAGGGLVLVAVLLATREMAPKHANCTKSKLL